MSKVFRIDEVETQEWDGVATMRWITSKSDNAKHLRFVHYTYEPNWSTKKTHLHHNRESAYYILKGKAIVHLNGEDIEMYEGMAANLAPGDIHGVVGAGPDGLVMLEVWAPAEPDIIYFEDGRKIE